MQIPTVDFMKSNMSAKLIGFAGNIGVLFSVQTIADDLSRLNISLREGEDDPRRWERFTAEAVDFMATLSCQQVERVVRHAQFRFP